MAENADSSSSAASSDKVVILLRATGDAPILRQDKVKIGGAQRFASVVDYLRKQLQRDSVFVYLRAAFCPCLDDTVRSLYAAYGEEGKLVVHYATTPAWG